MAKKPSQSYTSRTFTWLRTDHAWHAEVVERWNMGAGVRQDLFGCIDAIALPRRVIGPVLALQITSTGVSERCRKIEATPRMTLWVRCGSRLAVVGWRKLKGPGSKVARWTPRIVEFVAVEDDAARWGGWRLAAYSVGSEHLKAWREGERVPLVTPYRPEERRVMSP